MAVKKIPKMERRFFSIREISEILGVSRFTVARMVAIGTMPAIRLKGRGPMPLIRIDLKAFERLIEASKSKAAKPPDPLP